MYYRIQWPHGVRKRDGNKKSEEKRKRNERNTKKLNQWNESRMKGAIGDIVFGMHTV